MAHGWSIQRQPPCRTRSWQAARLSESDKDRLLVSQVGLTAFIVAEMQHFVNTSMVEFDQRLRYGVKWEMTLEDKVQAGLLHELVAQDDDTTASSDGVVYVENQEYLDSRAAFEKNGSLAVELLCKTTQTAFAEGFGQDGLLSALGSAIMFFRQYYRTPAGLAACERVGLSDYQVAHHITDMYHHRTFRGTHTKTLDPSGRGEIAARVAVGLGLPAEPKATTRKAINNDNDGTLTAEAESQAGGEEDECLLWSPTTPGVCLHWKSEEDAWRTKRFERIQMEGTRDPRRGGSGTTR
jgi:hypothetical protein